MRGTGDLGWAGEYRLVSRLGAGGMGEVFLARSAGGRAVAVKTVHAHLARAPEYRRRFAREAAAAARVGGAFTAPVLAADPEADVPWLATAFVAGPSLTEAVAAAGPLPDGSVRTVGAGLAEALLSIHGAGLTHRDLKPGNVLLSASGPRIIDFGLSRAEDATAFTATGQAVGTPGYLPPEALEGGAAGPAGDVFALGGVLAFAATGRHPYGGGSVVAILRRVLSGPPDLEGVEPGLRELLASCLNADPGTRPGADGLLRALGETGGTGGPAPLPRAVTALIAEREAWANAQLASVPYEEPPEPPEQSGPPGALGSLGPQGQPGPLGAPEPPEPPEERNPPVPEPEAGRRSRWRPSGGAVAVTAAVVALLVAAAFLVPRVWPGAGVGDGDLAEADAEAPGPGSGLEPPARDAAPSGGPPEYTLLAEHELDLPLPEASWYQSLALSPDGGTAYLKGASTPVLAVDTASGESLHTSEVTASGSITVAPDGTVLTINALGEIPPGEDSRNRAEPVVVVDAADGRTLAETGEGARGGEVAFTDEGQPVVTSPWGRTGLWDAQSGRHVRTIAPTGGQRLALSSDGSLVAFLREATHREDPAEEPARIEVWTWTGERVAEIDATADSLYTELSFQPGTTQLTAVGQAGVWMWDAATGDELGSFAHGLGVAARGVVDEGTGQLLLWSLGEGFVAVDLDARVPLGEVTVSEDSARADLATNTVHTALSADGSVLVRVGYQRHEDDGEPDTYHLYVWERV